MSKFRRLKLEHEYHDSHIISFSFKNDNDIEFEISLDGYWNNKIFEVHHLIFYGVRNFSEVKQFLESAKIKNKNLGYIDEIIDIERVESKYIINLSLLGSLMINARGISET